MNKDIYVKEHEQNERNNIPEIIKNIDNLPQWQQEILKEYLLKMKFICRQICPTTYFFTQVQYCQDCQQLLSMAVEQIQNKIQQSYKEEELQQQKLQQTLLRKQLRKQQKFQ